MNRFRFVIWLFLLVGTNCSTGNSETGRTTGGGGPVDPEQDFGFEQDFPEPELRTGNILKLWATVYYVPVVSNIYPSGYPLHDRSDRELGPRLAGVDWCNSAIEGSVIVKDGKGGSSLFNYAGRADGMRVDCQKYVSYKIPHDVRFRASDTDFGEGIDDTRLVPFRSIAVDSRQRPIPFKSLIYIPAARNIPITLPNGKQFNHDGYFFSADIGGKIKDNHIDVFIGTETESTNPFKNFVKNSPKGTFKAYIVNNDRVGSFIAKLHEL